LLLGQGLHMHEQFYLQEEQILCTPALHSWDKMRTIGKKSWNSCKLVHLIWKLMVLLIHSFSHILISLFHYFIISLFPYFLISLCPHFLISLFYFSPLLFVYS
jgi:hypothetical protein